jgi:hypothetical protein
MNLLRRVLAYVKQAQTQLETNANKVDRNAVLLSAHKQLVSMLDSSPLLLDHTISMVKLLEENALRLLYGSCHYADHLWKFRMTPYLHFQ